MCRHLMSCISFCSREILPEPIRCVPVGISMGKPRRITPTDDWQQLKLLFTSAEQERYEEVRPVVLFGQPPGARALETGTPAHTLRRRAARFERLGMLSLFDTPPQF